MKNRISFASFPATCTALFLMLCVHGYAQRTTTWKGGTPGRETAWDCPKNWSNNAVPDEFSNVIIPNVSTTTRSLPVIRSGEVEVNTLFIHPNARLTIAASAELRVLGQGEDILPHDTSIVGKRPVYVRPQDEGAKPGATAKSIAARY